VAIVRYQTSFWLQLMLGGDIAAEMSFKSMDDDLEEALQGTWTANRISRLQPWDTEISDISATTATVAAALGSAFKTGMLVLTGGFTTAANNNIAPRVVSSSATTIVFPAATFAVEATAIPVGASLRVVGFSGVAGDLVAVTAGVTRSPRRRLTSPRLVWQAGQW